MSIRDVVWSESALGKSDRAMLKNQKPCLIWLTGLSASGKSTIAKGLEVELYKRKCHTYVLDGDNVRHGLSSDLTFSDRDRQENIRRIAEVGKIMVDAGLIVITAFISPFRKDRDMARGLLEGSEFIEVFVDTPLEICEGRDPKGLYKKARAGLIPHFTGIDSPYEAPLRPELVLNAGTETADACVQRVLIHLEASGYLSAARP